MKKILLILSLVLSLFLFASLASATILLSNVNSVYNQGDIIKLETRLSQPNTVQGFFRISLFCDNIETLMYFSPIELQANKEKTITVNFPVAKEGSCYIVAVLQDSHESKLEETKSPAITLSNKIDVKINLNKKELKPKEKIEVTGTAFKANGQAAQGIAIITFNTFNKEQAVEVSNGKFSFSTELPADIAPGIHTLTIQVKENNNSGIATEKITILAVPTTLAIETNNESFIPDSLLMITPKLLDQANNTLKAIISVKLLRQVSLVKTEVLLDETISSGNSTLFRFTKFSMPGTYTIEASTSSFSARKTIIVEHYEKISADLDSDILHITNIGNVPFQRTIEIEFLIENQSTKKTKKIDLGVGQNISFKLGAPKGTYTIKVNTGTETLEFKNVPLTGYVVATIELNPKSTFDIRWLIGLLVLVAILVIVMLLLRTRKSYKEKKEVVRMIEKNERPLPKSMAETTQTKLKSAIDSTKKDYFPSDSGDSFVEKIFSKHASKQLAAHNIISTIVYGTKQEITALFVHLGLDSLTKLKKEDPLTYAKILDEYFHEIIQKIKEHQGVADLYGNTIIVLFNVIKQYRHDIAALKTAEAIKQITIELNKKLGPKGIKVEMRAGINTGMANLTSVQNSTVKYTAIGNTISIARALQSKALDGEILFPEKIHERVANVIKARKMQPYYLDEQHAINVYSLEDSTKAELRDKNQWYIRRALEKV